jgi:glycosyltransferase involved in cell wall biosynthesis
LPSPAIAFDVTPLQNGHRFRGIGTYVRGLAVRLANQKDVPIEFWGWAGDDSFQAPPPHRAVALPRFPMPEYRGAWLFAQLAMKRRARMSAVRGIHITDPDALTSLGDRKILTTVYDLIPLRQGIGRRQLIGWAGYQVYLRALKNVDTYFAISNQTAADLVDLLKVEKSKVVVAPPGIDLEPSAGSTPIATTRPYFLFLGGPGPNKNLAVVLDAMALCPELLQELRIAGHWLPKQLAALQSRLDARGLSERVRHVGFAPASELAQLMRSATALVIPSRFEGFGLPVAEGLATGSLVIHSKIPVLEQISAGAALTFGPDSAEELAACLRAAAGDAQLAERLRTQGIARAAQLTWDRAVAATLAAYGAALGA